MKYSWMEYSEFILAFQLQFGTYEAESEHFRWEKEKTPFERVSPGAGPKKEIAAPPARVGLFVFSGKKSHCDDDMTGCMI